MIPKRFIKALLTSSAGKPFQNIASGLGLCLNYHRVTEKIVDKNDFCPNIDICVTKDNFRKQIEAVSKTFTPVDISTTIEGLESNTLNNRSVVVSFDDGFKDNLELALPILEEFNVPAVIYITTGIIDQECNLWWYALEEHLSNNHKIHFSWDGKDYMLDAMTPEQKRATYKQLVEIFRGLHIFRQNDLLLELKAEPAPQIDEALSWDEVIELDKHPLITIGAHTRSHPVLSSLPDNDAKAEIIQSKLILEDRLGHPVEHFAYTFGDPKACGKREREFTRDAGFKSGVTTTSGHFRAESKRCLFGLPRVIIDYFDTHMDFLWKLYGFESYAYHKGQDFPGFE